jgi:hypothetical protein
MDHAIIQGHEEIKTAFFGFLLPLIGSVIGAISGGLGAGGHGVRAGVGAAAGALGGLAGIGGTAGQALGTAASGMGAVGQMMGPQPMQQPFPTQYGPDYFQNQSFGNQQGPQVGTSMDAMQLMAQLRSRSGGGMGMM